MIEVKNVTKRFRQGKPLFNHLRLLFGKGDFTVVTGPSGAGKTSLLQLVYGVLRPSEGQVLFENQDLYHINETNRALIRRKMGFVFQDFRLISHLTVGDNVALPLQIQGIPPQIIDFEVDKVLARVGMAEYKDELPAVLSGGGQQKVAVARAIINRPQWLLADEPTGNLDPGATLEMIDLFHEIHRQGTSVIIATHDEGIVKNRKGLCVRLEHGSLRGQFPC